MPDIMISYARRDARDFAGRLAASLQNHQIDAWLDTADIPRGAEWLQAIEQAIAACKVFVAVRSPGGRESTWVRRERLYALDARKPIIPVLHLDCAQDLELIDRNPVDFRHSFEQAFPQLLQEITRLSNGQTPKPQDRRTLELAYLGRILLEHSIWQDLYTPMAGVAQMRRAAPRPDAPQMVTVPNQIQPLFRQRMRAHLHTEEQHTTEQRDYTDILPAINALRQLVILGDPGGGKTTTLWRIAVDYAQQAQHDPTLPLPVFVRLGALPPDVSLEDHIIAQLGDLGTHYHTLLAERRIALLLDGLNELPTRNRGQQIAHIKALVTRCQGEGMVCAVTCRELDYVGDLDMGIPQQVRITPLDPPRIRQFVNGYIREPAGAGDDMFWQLAGGDAVQQAWEKWQAAGATFDLFWTADDIPRENPNVWNNTSGVDDTVWREARHGTRSMMHLARNPYMLYMMTQVFTEEACIPQNRGVLFRLFVDFLLLDREALDPADADLLNTRLAELAYAMQAQGEAGTTVSRAEALRVLGDEQHLYRAQSANILSGGDEIRFTHQLLQEFYAAHKLDAERQAGTPAAQFWPAGAWWEPQGWEETAILLAGLYSDDCTPVLDWLNSANPEVAARCITESGAHTPDATRTRLLDLWVARMTGSEPAHARAAVGRGVSLVGDPRPGVGLRSDGAPTGVGVPDIDWVEIPGGAFIYQDGESLDLPTFYIARYPITYAQFQAFLDDPDGFERDAWWADLMPDYRKQPMNPQRYPFANHPRDSVSWYQAVAYCRWLSARLGVEVRLPTEQEWEKAARGTDGRIYPYDKEFDAAKGNTRETGLGQTSAVGIFPQGASPYGVLDMSGNVWEWCLNEYSNPANTSFGGEASRVLRGGAFVCDLSFARCVARAAFSRATGTSTSGFGWCVVGPHLDRCC